MSTDLEKGSAEHYEAGAGGPSLSVFRVIWNHKALVLLGAVLGAIVGGLYFARCKPVYQSFGQVLVVKQRPDFSVIQGTPATTYGDDVVASHLTLIRSQAIVGQAVKDYDLGSLPSFAGMGDPTGAIIGGLSVARDNDGSTTSNILSFSYKGGAPDDCARVLEAVIKSYGKFLTDTYRTNTQETVNLIADAKRYLEGDLEKLSKDYVKFREGSDLLWKGNQGVNLDQETLNAIQTARSSLLIRRAETESKLKVFEKAVKDGMNREELLAIISKSGSKMAWDNKLQSGPAKEETALLDLLMQEQMLLQDFGKEHPKLQEVRKRIEIVREFLTNPPVIDLASPDEDPKKTAELRDPVVLYGQLLKSDLAEIDVLGKSMEQLHREVHDRARKMATEEVKDEQLRADMQRKQALFDIILKRLQEASLVQQLGNQFETKLITPPSPGYQIDPKLLPILGLAICFGLAGGVGLGYLAEWSDKSFRSPQEIRGRLGIQVIGHIPVLKTKVTASANGNGNGHAIDANLLAHHKPRSLEAEAYRGVRTALYFSVRGAKHKVVQVTSPNMGDGKTTLTTNLAVSMAQAGQRVVLVDADFRRPRVHKVFDVSARCGLASVIAGDAELDHAIQPSGIENLSLLPCGPIPQNPAELLTLPRFGELLEILRNRFDFVLIDTPPLLLVTDPCVVAPRVDGVILTIRVARNSRPQAERAKEILSTLGVEVLGVVVNGVGRQHGRAGYGYGYDHYKSGYGFDVGYGTGYGAGESYYQNDAAPEKHSNGDALVTATNGHKPTEPPSGLFGRLFGR